MGLKNETDTYTISIEFDPSLCFDETATMSDLIQGYIDWFNNTTEEERIIDYYANETELTMQQLIEEEQLTFKQANEVMKERNKT